MTNCCRRRLPLLLLFPALLFPTRAAARQVPFVIHVQSTFSSDGVMTIDEIAGLAEKKGIGAVIINDHDLMRWDYGLPPFRNIFRRTVQNQSVLSLGPDRFLNAVAQAQERHPEVLLIPGVESAPFYYWSGSPYRDDLTLHNWHRHLLVAGLPDAAAYRRLPVIGNEKNGGRFDLPLAFIALFLFALGLCALTVSRVTGVIIFICAILFFFDHFPFKSLSFDQYRGNLDSVPYQGLIDYVAAAAPETGIVFWAHPEAPDFDAGQKIGPVTAVTQKYPLMLEKTRDYTGFAYFQEGDEMTGRPGGVWDQVLREYAAGNRQQPVWAVAELDFRKDGLLGTYLDSYVNVLMIPDDESLNAGTLLKNVKAGSYYLASRPKDSWTVIMDRFSVSHGTMTAGSGQRLDSAGPDKIAIRISASDGKKHGVKLDIIRNGNIVESHFGSTPMDIERNFAFKGGRYYRIEAESENKARLVSNPIFANYY